MSSHRNNHRSQTKELTFVESWYPTLTVPRPERSKFYLNQNFSTTGPRGPENEGTVVLREDVKHMTSIDLRRVTFLHSHVLGPSNLSDDRRTRRTSMIPPEWEDPRSQRGSSEPNPCNCRFLVIGGVLRHRDCTGSPFGTGCHRRRDKILHLPCLTSLSRSSKTPTRRRQPGPHLQPKMGHGTILVPFLYHLPTPRSLALKVESKTRGTR